VAAAILLAPVSVRSADVPSAVSVTQSGIWGGGFINLIAKNPTPGSKKFVIGEDTSGFHVSPNAGDLWVTSNTGLNDSPQDTVAAVTYRLPPNNRQLFAAYGVGSESFSGILRSGNGGGSWTKVTPAPGTPLPVFQGHGPGGEAAYQVGSAPRATGKLLALDEAGGVLNHIYAGTFGSGVMRSDDGGVHWTRIALGIDGSNAACNFQTDTGQFHGCFITSVVLSRIPGETDTLYVSAHGGDPTKCIGNGVCGGVFRIANAACSGDGCADATTTQLHATVGPDPVNAEELLFTFRTLLCACGTDGFYSKSPSDPGLVQKNTNLAIDSEAGISYSAIAARGATIFLGAYNPKCERIQNRETCHTVYDSTDGGLTWVDLTFDVPPENIDLTVAGTDVEWWEGSQKSSRIDGRDFNVSAIALTDDPVPVVLVSGHSGVWKSTAADQMHWQPAVQGIGATTNNDVVADPNNPGYVYVGNTDWTVFASSAGLAAGTVVQTDVPTSVPKKTTGFALAVDQQDTGTPPPSDVYVAAGKSLPDSTDVGGMDFNPDPTTQPWTDEGFATDGSCDRTTPRLIGLAVGRATDTAIPAVFAATDGCGLYRFQSGAWSRIGASTDMFVTEDFTFNFAPISFPNSLGRVFYVLDRKTGELWRTADNGGTWSLGPIFTIPQGQRGFNDGWMVADPNVVGTFVVWLSTNDPSGLHKLTCVTQCQQPGSWTDEVLPDVVNPGPIAIPPCAAPCTSTVYVATRAVAGDTAHPPRLYKSTPIGGFCDVTAGASSYRAGGNFPVQLAVSVPDAGPATAYLTTVGAGTLLVTDDSNENCGSSRSG